jgi:hypothetical protein
MKGNHFLPGKRILAMIAVSVLLAQPGCRSPLAVPGQWLTAPAGANGQVEDFSKKLTSQLFENGMMVGVGNDEHYLYIFFSPDIRHQQRPPSRARLSLWLDEDGGKAKKLGLLHVSEPTLEKMPRPETQGKNAGRGAGNPAEQPSMPPDRQAPQSLLKIIDRESGKELFIAADGSMGPAVRLAGDWGDFAYQWRIPIQGAGDWPGLDCKPGKAIGIGLIWKIESLMKKADRERLGGGPGPGGPGGPGRPGGGQGGMEPPPGMEGGGGMFPGNAPSKRQIWIKTVLAKK